MCGCGERTRLATFTSRHRGNAAGQPQRFIRGHFARTEVARVGYDERRMRLPPPNASGLCQCGCGTPTPIAKVTSRRDGTAAGEPRRFVKGHSPRGRRYPNRPGWMRTDQGYVLLYLPDHPRARKGGYVAEHRYVWEQTNGRALERNEAVHHINGVKDDNRPENLVALTHGQHSSLHGPLRYHNPDNAREAGRKGAAARWGKREGH